MFFHALSPRCPNRGNRSGKCHQGVESSTGTPPQHAGKHFSPSAPSVVRFPFGRAASFAGTYQQVQNLNRTALAREDDRKAKEEAQRKTTQLAQENARLAQERRDAVAASEAADRRRRDAEEERSSSNPHADMYRAMLMHRMMFGGGQRWF